MTVIAIGLNHRSASAELMGRMAVPGDLMVKALGEFVQSPCVNEVCVLSTCNRTEIYVDAERFHDAYHDVRDALSVLTGVDAESFVPHLSVRYHLDAAQQLFRVAAGLDSAVLGEHEILGQVRAAAEVALSEGTCGSVLGPLFKHAVQCGKRVRTETEIGRHTVSLSHAALTLIGEHRVSLDGAKVLLIGTGDVGRGIASVLTKSAEIDLTVTNRTRERADSLADELTANGSTPNVVDFDRLAQAVSSADVVISGTAAPTYVVTPEMVIPHAAGRDRLLLDLAMPADIDPAITDHTEAQLLTLDDLQRVANRGIELRRVEAVSASKIVDEMIELYQRSVSADEVEPLLGSLHRWGNEVRAEQLDRYRSRLGQLDSSQLEAVEALTKAVVAKLLHPASRELRSATGSPRGDRLAEATRELFDLT